MDIMPTKRGIDLFLATKVDKLYHQAQFKFTISQLPYFDQLHILFNAFLVFYIHE